MSPLGFITLLFTVLSHCQGRWDNTYDNPLNFQCRSDSYAVSSIVSVHNSYYRDRRFDIGCTKVGSCGCSRHKSCYWGNWVNNMDELIHFTCRSNHYINGMKSYHRNHEEDRVWKFRCCAIHGRPLEDCTLSGWTNNWKGHQHFVVPSGQVIKGVVSIHNNKTMDRLYEYLVCKLGGREETRVTTLLDYLMQKQKPREMILDDYPMLDSQAESEEDPRQMALDDSSQEESLEESEEDLRDRTLGDFSKEESEEDSRDTTLLYRL